MLFTTRRAGDSIVMDAAGALITLHIVEMQLGWVRLGISAPASVRITIPSQEARRKAPPHGATER